MSFKTLSIVAAASMALFAGAANAVMTPVELAVNGGFETGTFDGWTQFEVVPGDQSITGDAAGGSYAGSIINNTLGSNSLFKQANLNLPGGLVAGEIVTISFDAKGSFGVGGVAFAETFSEKEGGGVYLPIGIEALHPLVNPNTWTPVSFTYAISAFGAPGGVTLQLGATTGGATGSFAHMFYDNVSISVIRDIPAVPEPGTYAMMLAGLVGVGAIARRRRSL